MKTLSIRLFLLFGITLVIFSCSSESFKPLREQYDLAGVWQFAIDTGKQGITEAWYLSDLTDSILLPGSLDENKKGFINTDSSDAHLFREYVYTGAAWFRNVLNIPENWSDKKLELFIERTKVADVWIDSIHIGKRSTIFTPQKYDLTGILTPGRHTISIRVDNTPDLVPVAGSHAYSEETQTNWLGILGKFCIQASFPTRIESVKTFPDVKNNMLKASIDISNENRTSGLMKLQVKADAWNTDVKHKVPAEDFSFDLHGNDTVIELVYDLGYKVLSWSEFDPALYKIEFTLVHNDKVLDNMQVDFGLRELSTEGTQFTINGLKTFLRGEHNGAVFPLTGYPPMDVNEWARIFRIAGEYGINHYRFHSWTPPEAAFIAADMAGIYIQTELPIWWGLDVKDSSQLSWLVEEGKRIMDAYANHPSFTMFALGNEISQERDSLKRMVADIRAYDSRPLFAQGSNNRLWDPSYAEGDDFWVTFRTGKENDDLSTDVRTSISHLDSKEGGLLNTVYPSTSYTYERAIEASPVPVIGHEIGQYQVYPNYEKELPKYTGVLKPVNLELYRKRLAEKGMADQEQDFFKASGALAMICYRADIETAFRTPGFGGFQLLDLQDYSGQGTALVGVCDAFMDSKGLITTEEFRQFCDEVVVLLSMEKYCWTANEKVKADVLVANYSPDDLINKIITWNISDEQNNEIWESGEFTPDIISQGSVMKIGEISLQPESSNRAQKHNIHLNFADNLNENHYPIWIFPEEEEIVLPADLLVSSKFDLETKEKLRQGGKVLLFPKSKDIEQHAVACQFISEFWNWGMFTWLAETYGGQISPGTLGILTDPEHPVFNDFPTEFHTNWQWWPMVKYARSVILDDTDPDYRPVVQIIDNINRNHKLGMIFEFKIDQGRLFVCSVDLPELKDYPEARQLYKSIIHYMSTPAFNPEYEISYDEMNNLLFN